MEISPILYFAIEKLKSNGNIQDYVIFQMKTLKSNMEIYLIFKFAAEMQK